MLPTELIFGIVIIFLLRDFYATLIIIIAIFHKKDKVAIQALKVLGIMVPKILDINRNITK